ncbi:MAG: glycoside hydrolase family 3 protein [Actinomycetales bacterium]|nr:glycoside hydrolase family 3 protein [Candidatus Phosphoribacter baldrii]
MSQAQRWGQLFMVGIQPAQAPAGIDAVLRSTNVGSVIYLGGWSGAASVTATSRHLQQVTTGRVDLFIAADQEGGAVQQLKGKGFTVLPAALDQGKRSAGELTALGSTLAQELRVAGVNVNLAPVADTVPPTMTETNAPIGKYRREFGTDPAVVAAAVPPVVSALQNGGVVATVKHFPGLGRITGNTDVTAVGITDSIATALDPHLDPFRAGIAAGVGMVMVSSARYPQLDDANPAMFSPAIITDLLRGRLGFNGVVITDDVGAAKAVAAVSVPDRAVRFLAAGGDIVLTASAAQAPAMLAAVKARAATDPAFASGLDASVRRVLELKARFGLIRCG